MRNLHTYGEVAQDGTLGIELQHTPSARCAYRNVRIIKEASQAVARRPGGGGRGGGAVHEGLSDPLSGNECGNGPASGNR